MNTIGTPKYIIELDQISIKCGKLALKNNIYNNNILFLLHGLDLAHGSSITESWSKSLIPCV